MNKCIYHFKAIKALFIEQRDSTLTFLLSFIHTFDKIRNISKCFISSWCYYKMGIEHLEYIALSRLSFKYHFINHDPRNVLNIVTTCIHNERFIAQD